MKIAFVIDAVWPYNKGGRERRLYELSTRLASKGHDIHIYCMKWWKIGNIFKENGVTLHAISPYYPLYSGERRSIKQALLFSLSCFRLLCEDFDVADIDSMPYFPLYVMRIVCWIKRKKMIATWHEVWEKEYWINYLGYKGNVAYVLEKISSLLPDLIVTNSHHTQKKVMAEYGRNSESIKTIYTGIDVEYISNLSSSKSKSDVIFVGRLLLHKRIDLLIQVVSLLRKEQIKIKAFIVGEGPEESNIRKLVKRLGLESQVILLGRVELHKNVLQLIKASKIFLLPSEREGFSIVALESNACGIPVLTVNDRNNATAELITTGKNGVITNKDANSIATGIKTLMKKNMKKACIDAARMYSWEKSVSVYEKVILTY